MPTPRSSTSRSPGDSCSLAGTCKPTSNAEYSGLTAFYRSFARTGLDVRTHVVVDPHPAEAILALARGTGAQLIGMASHGRHGPARVLLGGVSDKVLRGATVPVLVVPPGALPTAP